jgi:hypothetical protein
MKAAGERMGTGNDAENGLNGGHFWLQFHDALLPIPKKVHTHILSYAYDTYHTGLWWVMNTVDPRRKYRMNFKDVPFLITHNEP